LLDISGAVSRLLKSIAPEAPHTLTDLRPVWGLEDALNPRWDPITDDIRSGLARCQGWPRGVDWALRRLLMLSASLLVRHGLDRPVNPAVGLSPRDQCSLSPAEYQVLVDALSTLDQAVGGYRKEDDSSMLTIPHVDLDRNLLSWWGREFPLEPAVAHFVAAIIRAIPYPITLPEMRRDPQIAPHIEDLDRNSTRMYRNLPPYVRELIESTEKGFRLKIRIWSGP
jgi:hypothetical protein